MNMLKLWAPAVEANRSYK